MAGEVVNVSAILTAIDKANTPEDIKRIEAQIEAAETAMRKSGLYALDEIRPLNEARMRARWKLGQILAKAERGKAPGKGKMIESGFQSFLKKIGLTSATATAAQRIGALPAVELEKALAESRKRDVLNTFEELARIARPHWAKMARKSRHEKIAEQAAAQKKVEIVTDKNGSSRFEKSMGPFPLIYADPPWDFEVRSENGKIKSAENHYPTLTDDQIIGHLVQGKTINEIAHEKAVLFLWCTNSNQERALRVMKCWGFEYKTHAIWVKDKAGTGYYFRNQHEVLLCGTRGTEMAPQWQPVSVFAYPRQEHSVKPPEIRAAIERMYPDFKQNERLELFARGQVPGWSVWGFEAGKAPDDLSIPQQLLRQPEAAA